MRQTIFLLLLCLTNAFAGQGTTPELGIRDKSPSVIAFTNATIVVSPLQTIAKGTIVFRDGVITAVGAGITVPTDAVVTDMSGAFIYPAFIDPFTEYGVPKTERARRSFDDDGRGPKYFHSNRIGGNAWNETIHAERKAVEMFKPDSATAREFIKSGFAIVESGKLDGIFRGQSFVALLGSGLANDMVVRPVAHQLLSFTNGASVQDYPSSLMGRIALIRQTFLDADWYAKARVAYTANPAQEAPEYNAALEALATSRTQTMIFETEDNLNLVRARNLGVEFGVPFVFIGSNYEYANIDQVKATGASIILPVNFPAPPKVAGVDSDNDVSLANLRHWEFAPSNPSVLEKNGISFAFTSHRLAKKDQFLSNIRKAVKRGLTESTALAALTTIPAGMCGVADRAGTLQVGKLANLIVSDSNLFTGNGAIRSVWIAGCENKLVEEPVADFRGVYSVAIGSGEYGLSLKGKKASPAGEFTKGDQKYSLENVSLAFEQLEFTSQVDSTDLKGVLRCSARKYGDTLKGEMVFPDGTSRAWSSVLKEPFKPKADTSKKSEVTEQIVSKLTLPNVPFGWTSLPKPENVLVKNATVWTADEKGTIENADLLIRDGKIAEVGKGLTAPSGVRVIDATGKHVTPGIIDEHSHIAASGSVNEGVNSVSCEVRIGDIINPEAASIYRQLACGLTTSHILHGSANPIGGQLQLIKLRWGQSAEGLKFKNAPPTVKFALGENVKQSHWGDAYTIRYPQTRMGVETLMRDAFQTAKEYESAWKGYNALSAEQKKKTIPPRRDLQLDALADIMNSRMFIHCHSYVQSEILALMRLAESFGFRVQTFTHILEGYKVATEMAKHGAGGSSFADWWAYKFEVYDAIPYNPAIMHEHGVLTSVNSDDAEMARRLNQEAAKSVLYGDIPASECIKFCTINSAKQLKVDKWVGSLTVGKDADFVIWSDNPLSIYAHAEQTWIEGTKYFDLENDKAMRKEVQTEKNALIQKALKSKESGGGADDSFKPDEEIHTCNEFHYGVHP
ncbi:MAG: amidohydrolase family protein [Candidatus Zixiibacteriota bacterium]